MTRRAAVVVGSVVHMWSRRRGDVGWRWALILTAALLLVALGYSAGSKPEIALAGAVVVLGLGLVSVDMVLVPLLAFPGMLLLNRVGGTLSASDLVLFVATLCAVLMLRTRKSEGLRQLLWVVVAYQAALIPTLISNMYSANYVEWIHEALLVGGSLIVGWVVGNAGRARLAVNLYIVPMVVLALWACALAPVRHFEPVYLLNFQKNALGDLLAFAVLIAYARPSWLGLRNSTSNVVALICAMGMLATQSRQAVISVVVGVAIIAVRGHVEHRRSRLILLAMVPLVVIAYVVTVNQLSSTNKFNSANQRLTFYHESFDVWRHARWLGVGLRWWYTGRFGFGFQPPNAELEMLTSAGIVGLAAFLITAVVALRLLWRVDPRYGTVAFAVLAARLVQGQLDLFWVASQSSLPWLVAGLALGVQSFEQRITPRTRPAESPVRPPERKSRVSPRPRLPATSP